MSSFACPNTPGCGHPSFVHDVYDQDDPTPACCVDGCRCGHVGDAVTVCRPDGTKRVLHADRLIVITTTIWHEYDERPWFRQGDGVIQLDEAGEYRYRYLRPLPGRAMVYERITADGERWQG